MHQLANGSACSVVTLMGSKFCWKEIFPWALRIQKSREESWLICSLPRRMVIGVTVS